MNQLPSELVSSILHHVDKKDLYACSLVNKSIYKETIPLLWRKLIIDSDDILNKITTAMTISPHQIGQHVRSVSLKVEARPWVSNSQLLALIHHVPGLKQLQISNAYLINDTSLKQVARTCPDLSSLSIRHLRTLALELWGRIPGLEHAEYYTRTFTALKDLPLQHITMHTTLTRNDQESRLFATSAALGLAVHQHRLTYLNLHSHTSDSTSFITTANEHSLQWPHLMDFRLGTCLDLDDHHAIQFIQRHPRLHYLHLSSSQKITDTTLDAIPMFLPRLRQLRIDELRQVTATGLCQLVKRCVNHLVEGVWFFHCGIYLQDDDFPKDTLAPRCYQTYDNYYGIKSRCDNTKDQVVWLAGNAFDEDNNNNNNKTLE